MKMATNKLRYRLILALPFILFFTLFIAYFSDAIFFWDTVSQASKRGNFYFQTNFESIILATDLDSGHPPFFNIYVALCWKLFGRTLAVSHWMMLPFVIGILYQMARLISHVFPKQWHWWMMCLFVIDTTFLAQTILISPDIVMLFGFLWSLNAIWEKKHRELLFSTFFLPFVSIRGIVLLGVIFTIQMLQHLNLRRVSIAQLFKLTLPFLPVGILLIIYLCYHYLQTGWLISSPNPNWTVHREVNDLYNVFRNIGLIIWRFLDNGRIICSGFLLFFLWKIWQHKLQIRPEVRYLLIVFTSYFLLFIPVYFFFSVAINNRYLLYAFLFLHLIIGYGIIQYFQKEKTKKIVLLMVMGLLFSGSFWVYPKHIAQGWDGTLAHLPYYELREKMIEYLQSEGIPFNEIGTEFPNKGVFDHYDLSGRMEGFVEKDFTQNQYIFYSNVMNDFTDEELLDLARNWDIIKSYQKVQICVILYKKRAQ